MIVLTAAQMREADRLTIARGAASQEELMRRAAQGLVDFLEREFTPLAAQRVVIVCGTGNNGGDGLVAAQMLAGRVANLQVVRLTDPPGPLDNAATIVVDALFGTGFHGTVEGRAAQLIHAMNEDFPRAKIVAVDIPSAMQVRADFTVTFAAPKAEMLMSPNAHLAGQVNVADIGIPQDLMQSNLALSEAADFKALFRPRERNAHKGNFGHVLVVGGAPGKVGAASMAGLSALRAGAGLVTVACSDSSRLAPELMTQPLDQIDFARATALAIGPGLGMQHEIVANCLKQTTVPTVIDADALNCVAGSDFRGRGVHTVLTPHPGEMARLLGRPVEDRLLDARRFAKERNVCLALKGFKTLVAFPDGQVWINPTGSPAMAKGGSGDILTGLTAGLIAQFPNDVPTAVRAAVWLHGRAGELAARELTEFGVLATDLLHYLPAAMRECGAM